MKRLVSLITALVLIFQFSIVSGFAAPTTIDKALFKDTSEIFGIYDCSYTYISILHVDKETLIPYLRNYTEKDFYESEDFSFKLQNYQLSSDKKTITATFTTYLEDVQYHGQYVFKKDATGKIYFNAADNNGVTRNIYKAYNDTDAFISFLESSSFNKTILAEKSFLKKVNVVLDQIDVKASKLEDSKPILADNYLDGFYGSSDMSQYASFNIQYSYNPKDYSGLYTFTKVSYTIGTKTYTVKAKSFVVKNGVATYLQDAKNYMEISATNRTTISNIKIVKDGKVISNQKVNLTLSK